MKWTDKIVRSVKTGKNKDINVILELFKLEKDKRAIVPSPTIEKKKKMC